ncbi:MAG: Lrp/AsnC ligand binding domain-containing protein [Candidatus Hodarchaeota archaeon]
MPLAFILINTVIGKEDEVISALIEIPNVLEVKILYGAYDLIVKVQEESMHALKELITSKIRNVSDINTTLTMIVLEESTK